MNPKTDREVIIKIRVIDKATERVVYETDHETIFRKGEGIDREPVELDMHKWDNAMEQHQQEMEVVATVMRAELEEENRTLALDEMHRDIKSEEHATRD